MKMILIIPRIPDEATVNELRKFVNNGLRRRWFFSNKESVDDVKIMVLRDVRTNVLEHHGLVYINNEVLAAKIVKRLNRTSFLGKMVNVREYKMRSWHNDRRMNHLAKADVSQKGKRLGDRRRGNNLEEVTRLEAMFYGIKDAARKLV